MKTTETTAARGSAIALEVLNSASGNELDRIMDLGLPATVFTALAASLPPVTLRLTPFFDCDLRVAPLGLSGLKPRIFLSNELSELEASSTVAIGLFEMARSIYLGELAGSDRSDLDVWVSSGLDAIVRRVSPRFISDYEDDRSMLRIEAQGSVAALGSFTALKRLVLQDG